MIVALEQKDESINQLLIEKMTLFKQLAESVDRGAAVGKYNIYNKVQISQLLHASISI